MSEARDLAIFTNAMKLFIAQMGHAHTLPARVTLKLQCESFSREMLESIESRSREDHSVMPLEIPLKRGGFIPSMKAFEAETYIHALEATGWNKTHAAAQLGLNRTTFDQRLRRLGICRQPAAGDVS